MSVIVSGTPQEVSAFLSTYNHETKLELPLKKKRTLSPEARAKISVAQKTRWAKQKKVSLQFPGVSSIKAA